MPLAPRGPGLSSASRPEWSQTDFAKQVTDHGYDVRWSKFAVCPNMDPAQPDHHRLECTICDRGGRAYYDITTTRMIVSSFSMKPQVMPDTRYDTGVAYFSTKPGDRVSYRDKIELLYSKARYSEWIPIEKARRTYQLRYPALSVEYAMTDRGPLGQLPDVIVSTGQISLTTPVLGNFLSVTYLYHPTYIVIDVPHFIRDSRITVAGVDMPAEFGRQAVAQLEFLLHDNIVVQPDQT